MTYYELIYDKRLGGDNIFLYDEKSAIPYKTINGEIVARETELPLVGDDMIQIAKNGSPVAIMHHGKALEINPEYIVVGEYRDFTDEQLDNICKNLKKR